MGADPGKPLPDQFHDWISAAIDADGVSQQGLIVDGDDRLIVFALHVPVPQAYQIMVAQFQALRGKEAIFGVDRFTKPDQGTTLGDLVAGHHLTRAGTRPFIIEYQHDPRIVKPICWDNPFWNAGLNAELLGFLREQAGLVT